jgi:hypothetical protein
MFTHKIKLINFCNLSITNVNSLIGVRDLQWKPLNSLLHFLGSGVTKPTPTGPQRDSYFACPPRSQALRLTPAVVPSGCGNGTAEEPTRTPVRIKEREGAMVCLATVPNAHPMPLLRSRMHTPLDAYEKGRCGCACRPRWRALEIAALLSSSHLTALLHFFCFFSPLLSLHSRRRVIPFRAAVSCASMSEHCCSISGGRQSPQPNRSTKR